MEMFWRAGLFFIDFSDAIRLILWAIGFRVQGSGFMAKGIIILIRLFIQS
jgi:hypothetical protein